MFKVLLNESKIDKFYFYLELLSFKLDNLRILILSFLLQLSVITISKSKS